MSTNSESVPFWEYRERGFRLVFGASAASAEWRSELSTQEREMPEVKLRVPDSGYVTFGALDCLLEAVLPVAHKEAPGLVQEYEKTLHLFTNPVERNSLGRLVPLAESTTLGTTRRISRESHDSAKIIDGVSRFLSLLPLHTSAYSSGLLVVAPGLEYWDRPSLRVLYRTTVLSCEEAPLSVVGLCAPRRTATEDTRKSGVAGRMFTLRSRFLANLADRDGVHSHSLESSESTSKSSLARFPCEPIKVASAESEKDLLRSIGEALSFQNFERVLLLVAGAEGRVSGELGNHLLRLSAISDAQSGDLDAARDKLAEAITRTQSSVVTAHLRYLLGLICTKRFYSLSEALQHYQEGKAAVRELVGSDPEARVEYAWLLNGEALVSVMQARSAPGEEERSKLHEEAFSKAFEAFRLVRADEGISAFYLRHNLAANITFLLEITARIPEARKFWVRVMEAPSRAESQEFQLPYRLRTGLLQHKEGDESGAMAALEDSLSAARALGDIFYEERVLAALAYVAATTGRLQRAREAFMDGMALAARLRDVQAQQVHATGLLWLAARGVTIPTGPWPSHVHAWPLSVRKQLTTALSEGMIGEALAKLTLRLQAPGPKLPPYIPFVDLEGAPQQDLNRLLVDADSDQEDSGQSLKEGVGT